MTFAPTVLEQNVVTAIFNKGDPDKLGIINAENAVKILTGAKLPPNILGEIWAIADNDNNGFLTRKGVAVAVRLIGWAQKGEPVSEDLLDKVGPLAQIDGISLPRMTSPAPAPPSNSSMAAAIPNISAADRAKFIRLFVGCGPSGGLLTGEKARDVFVKSNLPVEKLGQIWNLSDTQSRGALDQTDFIIGMFFIQLAMSQPNFILPANLPAGLYEQASGGRPTTQAVQAHNTGGSTGLRSPAVPSGFSSPLKPQYTGQALRPQGTGSAVLPQHTGQLASAPHTGAAPKVTFAPSALSSKQPTSVPAWDVTPQEKSTADNFFKTLDTQRRGFIEGDTAVPFFLKSNLPESILAQIWDLSDLHKDGRLTEDGFAIALHLINGNLAGKEVPETLPEGLIPPSMRKPANQLSEIQQDLWLLGDTPPASANNQATTFVQQQATGGRSHPPEPQHKPRPSITQPNRNFLDDDESSEASPEQSVPDHSVKIGNVRNQLDSTNRSLNGSKTERVSLESSVASSAAALSQLETQLAAAKASYETETRLVTDLRTRYSTQMANINKTREELITAESDLSALRQEKAEVEGAVLRDKEEVRELQRKMKQVGDETDIIKKEIDRVKKDARHQKGLLAINKKQVATAEGEREKQEKELDVAKKVLELATKEVEDAQATEEEIKAQVAARSAATSPALEAAYGGFSTIPAENDVLPASPAVSVSRSTASKNPFDKLLGAGSSTPRSASTYLPFAQPPAPAQDDDPFGFATAFAAEPVTTPPPVASQIVSPSAESPPPRLASPAPIRSRSPELIAASPAPARSKSPESMTLLEVQPPKAASPEPHPSGTGLDDASRFPALDAIGGANESTNTDLPPLKEMEHDSDSDSESDADSDDLPLARAAVKAREAKDAHNEARPMSDLTSPSHDSAFDTAPEDSVNETPTPRRSQSPELYPAGSAQHEGPPLTTPTVPSTQAVQTPFATFDPASQGQSLFTPAANTSLEPKSTTVSDFDEAFGQMGGSVLNGAASEPTAFKFDDAFGDTFDFGSTPAIDLGTPATASNEAAFPATHPPPSDAELFPLPYANGDRNKVKAPVVANTAPPSAAPGVVSFDDAFGLSGRQQPQQPSSNATTQSFELNSPTTSREASATSSHRPVSPTTSMATSVASTQTPRPVPHTPTSPTSNGRSSPQRSNENGSMRSSARKDNGFKSQPPPSIEQPAPAKSSKFHFPGFGRSKTQKRQKSIPAATYAPMASDRQTSTSSRTPSILDPTSVTDAGGDVEGVKRIIEMGFTRDQAVVVLEKHGYDMRLALADLLGDGSATS
ncbi:hypothetical protein FRB96_007580 [Tulasnella sp. 330]|nr:hypothetical protein FRB96_007580 [Tulasnella sp. 330]KAG8889159.1 hypothetical protein FRB98_005634 [Tulasnella sp. 332]